ncbi:PIG-L family deacetylase [Omnitrophica bacterium]|nr:PIG-L family deacetylase [Candidatus Omnitrophota bacterium]
MISRLKRVIRRFLMFRARESSYKFIMKDWTGLKDLRAVSQVLETKRFSQNLEPVIMPKPKAQSALIIAPHPDDDVFSSGGTILKLIQDGCRVKVIYLTSGGEKTYKDGKGGALTDSAAKTEEESNEASKALGTDIEFWRYPTRGIDINKESIDRLRKAYRELRPDVVFAPFIADDHDDHRRAIQLFYESFKDSKELDFEVWAYQVYSTVLTNVVVDITEVIDEKIRLVGLWKTRAKSRDWPHYIRGLNALNSRFLKTSEARYAESFFVVPAKEYIELCGRYFTNPAGDLYYCESYKKGY